MFPRNLRLRRDADVRNTIWKGTTIKMPFFIMKFISKWVHLRSTIVVSKKIDKSAVNRNRIKRIFREALRQAVEWKEIKWDMVIFPSPRTLEMKSTDLIEGLRKAINRII